MSDPRDDLRTDAAPETDPIGPGGEDSVQELHRRHMDIMNDPVVLSVDGTRATTPDPVPVGQDFVQAIHDVFMREQAEPRDGFEPVPMWVYLVFGGLLLWGGYYVGTMSADFRPDVYDAAELRAAPPTMPAPVPDPKPQTLAEMLDHGEKTYKAICATCHQPNGEGKSDASGRVPPLAGSEWVVGAEASPQRMARIVLHGLQGDITVKGTKYTENMQSQGSTLKDYQVAAVIAYVRNKLPGNAADTGDKPPITTDEVKGIRAADGARGPMSAAELREKYPAAAPPKPPEPKAEPKPMTPPPMPKPAAPKIAPATD